MVKQKPYNERTDIEKINSQWRKLNGHHSREDWSAAVVRAATAVEISLNLAIRSEFKGFSQLDATFIDNLLIWANGSRLKFDKLLLPLCREEERKKELKRLKKLAEDVHEKRNAIVHQGEFCSESLAIELIEKSKKVIEGIVKKYDSKFILKDISKT